MRCRLWQSQFINSNKIANDLLGNKAIAELNDSELN